jgi:hypothetical protein
MYRCIRIRLGIRRLKKGENSVGKIDGERERRRTDRVNSRPFRLLALKLRLPETSPLLPVLEASIRQPRRLPKHRSSAVGVGSLSEPARSVRRKLASLTLATGLALVLLEIRLELIRSLEFARFEGVLIGTETAVGGRKPRLEVVVDVVESDGVRGEVEGHAGRLWTESGQRG